MQENIMILHALLLGILFSFLYDSIRVSRRLFSHGRWMVHMENLFFWMFCALVVFRFLHREGNGTLRWFAVLSAALGMYVYMKALSRFHLKLSLFLLQPVVRFFEKALCHVMRKIKDFTKWLLTAIGKLLKMVGKGVRRYVKSFRRCRVPEDIRKE